MYTCSRANPMACSMELSNCPARPTNGSPLRSSSAPGASPTMSQSACGLPTPNTVCVRVALKPHRVQAATRARSSFQSAPASRAGDTSRVAGTSCATGTSRAAGTRRAGAGPADGAGKDAMTSDGASSAPWAVRSVHVLRPRASKYSRRSWLFMRSRRRRPVSAPQLAVEPNGRRRCRVQSKDNQQRDRRMQEDEDEGQRYEYDIGESDTSAGIHVLEAVKGETADHQCAGGCGHHERQYQSRQAYVGLVAGKPDQGRNDGGCRRTGQTLEVVLVLRGPP